MNIDSDPHSANEITRYLHCARCVMESQRPARIAVGLTPGGIQVWCERHRCNVALIELSEPMDIPPCELCERGVDHQHGSN